ncbi:Putative phosphatidate phosphatase APP1, catalytic domain-containing protein [Colletotrichum destructivum]|uniref:Phosphatidate phosphatase APP1, catalytic domain-containing protein n=1 Tax=Colletotrichum destructivum TaxID=34406 RepID=A0AAX4ICM1_9PEZI|nr:Putative phosphatidate phosphatase APP1, catalytic domain-containing protein [Colletotrichum destructivum]
MTGQDEDSKTAAAYADEMQKRTRKERRFDEVEAQLPNPRVPTLQSALMTANGLLSHLGSYNPWGRPVTDDDIVWLLDNTAYKPSRLGSWQAEFVAAIFEKEPKCAVVDIVQGVAQKLGLADDAEELQTIEERILPFLWDVQPSRLLRVVHQKRELKLGPSATNGISTDTLKVHEQPSGTAVTSSAAVPRGATGLLEMQTYFAAPEGWAIISDVDDTIKLTQTSDPIGILRETFVNEPTPIEGMPELYRNIKALLPQEAPWFYLSASPYNLYPFLREFRDKYYPPGTIILRDSSWKTVAGLLSALTMATEEYKVERMRKVHGWLPKRKFILIGDSTQSDPEAYGNIYREFKGWVKLILIRKVTDIAAVGISAKNEPERFEKAFKHIPRDDWFVFENPVDCNKIIRDTIAQDA